MLHLPVLISDLGIILSVAGLVILLFKKIGQPVVLGYLLAGFLVGPEIHFLPTVQDRTAIQIWAEIGVIILLFGLGLEFSFKKLLDVGRGATITALTEVLFMLGVGYLLGQAFGWSPMDSLFLGGILSISSTTIIIRAFEELGLRQKSFVQLVFGVLIVEDLVAILLLVLLSTIAVTKSFAGLDLVYSAGKLIFFLSIWFIAGVFFIPWFLQKNRKIMNEETSLIFSLGLCLTMVILATKAGFSPALGAFMMGSILAETPDGEKIEKTLKSVKDLFAAIFFVSVGMLIQIQPLKQHWLAILIITIVTILGKTLSTSIGAIISGQSIKKSIQSGMSLAQIGEFSFIIATLGLSLGVISDFLYPLAVTVSAITTLTTPYMIKYSEPFCERMYNWLPKEIQIRIDEHTAQISSNIKSTSEYKPKLKLFLSSIVVVGIGLIFKVYAYDFFKNYLDNQDLVQFLCVSAAILSSLPFMWSILNESSDINFTGYRFEDISALTSKALLSLVSRILISLFLLAYIISLFVSAIFTFLAIFFVTLVIGYLAAQNLNRIYQWFETKFIFHLNEKERSKANQILKSEIDTKKYHDDPKMPKLAPWDVQLSKVIVNANSILNGQKIGDINLREKYKISIAMIERGDLKILPPTRDDILMTHDQLVIIGADNQIESFAKDVELPKAESILKSDNKLQSKFILKSIVISEESVFKNLTIKDSKIRQLTGGLIVGVEHDDQRILNPEPTEMLYENDIIWIVGQAEKLQLIK